MLTSTAVELREQKCWLCKHPAVQQRAAPVKGVPLTPEVQLHFQRPDGFTRMVRLKALEFYSGIGGMHYALKRACPGAEVAAAFEINEVANDVYQTNFGARPYQGNIGALTAEQLDRLAADLWLLAPPCQPYTRRGLRRDAQDPRAASFLHLLSLLDLLQKPPHFLLVENVVGFEASDTRQIMASTLANNGFHLQEFVLSPLQVGLPYSRPRYFALAHRQPAPRLSYLDATQSREAETCSAHDHQAEEVDTGPLAKPCEEVHVVPGLSGGVHMHSSMPGSRFSRSQCSSVEISQPAASSPCTVPPRQLRGEPPADIAPIGDFIESGLADTPICRGGHLSVPRDIIFQTGRVFDIVTASSKRCNCFTKAYAQYAKGSGSVIATQNLHLLQVARAQPATSTVLNEPRTDRVDVIEEEGVRLETSMMCLGLRYFSPREIANLHSFPSSFSFHAQTTQRQQYALLGNSLSVQVVADLIQWLLYK